VLLGVSRLPLVHARVEVVASHGEGIVTVMVDELRVWPHAHHRCFMKGSAHLTADTLDELHAFAAAIGMKRSWFQDHPLAPHYDLSPSRHALALQHGAVLVSAREQARARIAQRAARRAAL
jgi:hypothetical protein